MVEIDVSYEGDLHTQAVHVPSGSALGTDAPKDNEGLGATFSPTDLLATALGSCVLTTMGIVARRNGWPLEGSVARVVKHMTAQPTRRVGRLELRFALPDMDDKARTILERAAHTCPVHRSLHPDVEVHFDFAWGALDAEPGRS
jgi:putative redox protein